MLGISRYDPSAAAASASTSKDASSTAEQQAVRLRALKDQIAARKRKRDQDDEHERITSSTDKGKQRAVSFSVGDKAEQEPPAANGLINDGNSLSSASSAKHPPPSILKPAKASLSQATKEKTTAKKKYLKRKLERKKAKKRSAGKNGTTAGDDASSVANGDGDSDGDEGGEKGETENVQETPEQRKARKKALKEARRNKQDTSTMLVDGAQAGDGVAIADTEAEKQIEKAKRKEARQAKKAAKAASKVALDQSEPQDVTMQEEDEADGLISTEVGKPPSTTAQSQGATEVNETKEEEFTRKEKLMLAKLAELKTKQAKQNQKGEALAKAAAKAKSKGLPISVVADAQDKQEEDEEMQEDEPTQEGVLPRFPAPEKAVVPSQKELDALAISHELREAILVDQNESVPISTFFSPTQETPAKSPVLSQYMQERLKEAKIENFFAVQKAVLPILLEHKQLYAPFDPPRDLCVSAPTGSGKTLSYVIPIVEILSKRIVTRLRALIVLPTRDLVVQVKDVIEQFAKGTGLKVGTATGQHSFAHEQNSLVEDTTTNLAGGSSKVDILIVTPGRLIDHLKSTPNFSLQHLRYLVIDEADRLLNQSFNDWLTSVLGHIERSNILSQHEVDADEDDEDTATQGWLSRGQSDPVAPVLLNKSTPFKTDIDLPCKPSTQKLLFSATLTRDPARVAALHLYKPVYLAVVDRSRQNGEDSLDGAGLLDNEREYVLPSTLKETMLTIPTFRKPLLLLHLLYTLQVSNLLCFTKSVESAGRLVLLLEAFNRHSGSLKAGQLRIANYTSELQPSQRKTILEDFTLGKIQVLICSDLIARGMDLPSVENVVNYDVPIDMRKYVHRVGRTARAGREGHAWSLVESQEASYFKGLLKEAKRYELVKKVKVKKEELDIFEDAYEAALLELRE